MGGFDDAAEMRLRCAYYAYEDSGKDDHLDERQAWTEAINTLQSTIADFLEGRLNLGTVKYRMDNAAVQNAYAFPSRSVTQTMSDLALGVPVDDLERELRRAFRLPDDLGEAKGRMLDLENFTEGEVERGHLKRSQAGPERWPELLACLWHIQSPQDWPTVSTSARKYFVDENLLEPLEPAQDYADHASLMRELSDTLGVDFLTLEQLFGAISDNALEVQDPEVCYLTRLRKAKEMDLAGQVDGAIVEYEKALSLRPASPDVIRRKAELYESKGLMMMAIGEMESLIELEPKSLADHRKLLVLYKSQKMIKDYNREVLRYKELMLGGSG